MTSDDAASSEAEAAAAALDAVTLAAEQTAFRLTPTQAAAAEAAALAQQARAEAAERGTVARDRRPQRSWFEHGGAHLEERLLEHVDLVDARYLISLYRRGGIVPRWQDTPPSAKIHQGNVWRLYQWMRMFSLGVTIAADEPEQPVAETARPAV